MEKHTENITYEADDLYAKIKENTVSSKNQLKDSQCVRFENLNGKGKRVLFMGNSITLHGIVESIGWYNEYGMAASSKDNDYVHILENKINEIIPDSQFCICQVSPWESEYKNGKSKYHIFENAREFDADYIVMRSVENCPIDDFDPELYKKELDDLLNYLSKSSKAKIILTTGFWKHPGDEMIIEYGKDKNLPVVYLGDLGEMDEMKAIGLFEHRGVARHPGDLGMKTIADRIFTELKKIL